MGGNIKVGSKVWLELDGRPLIGKGRYELLNSIRKIGSLKRSAEMCGISYKTAQNYIKKIEERLGKQIVETNRGGDGAGGETILNSDGEHLLNIYKNITIRERHKI